MNKVYRLKVVGLLGLPLIAIAIAALLLLGGRTETQVTEATGGAPGMDLACDDTAYTGGTINCLVTSLDTPAAAVGGFNAEIVPSAAGISYAIDACANEMPVTYGGGSAVQACANGVGGAGEAQLAVVSQVIPPPVGALDLPASSSGDLLWDTDWTCDAAGSYTLTLSSVPASAFGAVYADTMLIPVLVKASPSAVESVDCTVEPTATYVPEEEKDTSLVADVSKVLQGEVINLSGAANFRQDLDGDTVAGWGGGLVTFDIGALGVDTAAAAASGANATCVPVDPVTAGCAATVDKDPASKPGSVNESADPINYSISVSCDVVGTHTLSVTTAFVREDGSPVPPEKAVSNTASVEVTCNPLTPPMIKVDTDVDGDVAGDNLDNLFLTAQGAKLPPLTCGVGTDTAVLEERIGMAVTSLDPKGSQAVQDLAAFEFEVRFDNKLVCVNIEPGPAAADMECIVRDKDTSQLEGIAQIACFTVKGNPYPDTTTDDGQHLADVIVRPQPELYSQLIANQDNGIAVQILNQDCELSDAAGHPIPIFSCEDADITVRMLEGDVDASCDVNAATDGQILAFRWGAELGNLLYNARYDLEPIASVGGGGVNGDGDIDVKDIQAVFGRHGSTCADPNPPQPPVNPKS